MAKYELNSTVFLAGQRLEPGLIVTVPDDFIPGKAYTPIDEAALAAYAKYEERLPASLKPRASSAPLAITVEEPGPDSASKEVDLSESLAGTAVTQAKPGLSEAGAAPVAPTKS